MKKIIRKHKNGLYFCELQEEKCPYSNFVAFGETAVEAEINTFELRRKTLEEQLKVNPVIKYNYRKLK